MQDTKENIGNYAKPDEVKRTKIYSLQNDPEKR